MCRAGRRRCPGNDSTQKTRLRKRISRAHNAMTAARAAGDDAAAALAESKVDAARAELAALNAEHPASGGDVTAQQHDDGHLTVVNTNYGGTVGIQAGFVGGVPAGPSGTPGQSGDVTGRYRVVNTSHGGHVGVQVGVVMGGGVVIGNASGPVHTGDGVQINGGSWGDVSSGVTDAHRAAMDGARAARAAAKEARQHAKQARKQAKQERHASGAGNVTISCFQGAVMMSDGFTVIGDNVYRHPGRSVSVNGTDVTDSVTGQPIEPTHTVPDTGGRRSVFTSDGVLHVNGIHID